MVPLQLGLGTPQGRILIDGNTTWDGAAHLTADPWNQVTAGVQLQLNITLNPPVAYGDGINSVVFSGTIFGESFGSRTLAVTVYRASPKTMIEADVLVNNQQTFDSYRGPLRFDKNGSVISDIQRVLIHELGHVIGLDHPDTHGQHVDAIMNSVESNRDTLSSDDIAGACALYSVPRENGPATKTDFNADGFPDYLLSNGSTRQTAIWHLLGNTLLNGVYGPVLPAGWIVACVADMNADGSADYLLFNPGTRETAIWFPNGATLISKSMGPALPAGWRLIAAVDTNGDAQPDYVLFNATTRETMVWFLDGTVHTGTAPGPTLPPGWSLTDVNDLDGDGQPDFLLFNASTRRAAIWYLAETTFVGSVYGPTLPAGWTLRGSADFDRDGHPDYLLFNVGTRQTAIWFLNGNVFQRGVYGPTVPASYNLVSP